MTSNRDVRGLISENLGFKIIAALITFVLWLTILGRREILLTKTFQLQFNVASQFEVLGQSVESVEIKLSGSRLQVKKYLESLNSDQLRIDVGHAREGLVDVMIKAEHLALPLNVKLVSIKPSVVRVEVVSQENYKKYKKTQ